MPRVNIGIPQKQKELEEELRERYGGYLTQANLQQELGLKRTAVFYWVSDLEYTTINGMRKFRAKDVARKLYENTL
jgi:hypothetical protein